MTPFSDTLSPWLWSGLFLVPLVWLLGALWKRLAESHAARLGNLALGLTGASLLAGIFLQPASAGSHPMVRGDAISQGMLALIGLIGWGLVRYSTVYLQGDPGRTRFLRWLMATLASVTVLVLADHLAIFSVAWIATSLCLHQLLVFYGDRPMAVIAAHKKFLISRIAEVCLLSGFALLAWQFDTLHLSRIVAEAAASVDSPSVQSAMLLLTLAAILKCAQLPFHGWLIQVMETPTPVSALLHAGIINLGGFLLLSFAPLLDGAEAARWVLVIVGGTTAALAGLITMTRVSVKVGLAWSTCAQMGFMLLEVGLGLYELAFLHLLAHSLYKAHAFLSSGRTVVFSVLRHEARTTQVHRPARWLAATLLGLGLAWGTTALAGLWAHPTPALAAAAWILGLGLATLLGEAFASGRSGIVARAGVTALMIGLLYGILHRLFSAWIPAAGENMATLAPSVVAAAMLTIPFLLYVVLRVGPQGPALRRLYALLYHGLYLDEAFTRFAIHLWPPKTTEGKFSSSSATSNAPSTASAS